MFILKNIAVCFMFYHTCIYAVVIDDSQRSLVFNLLALISTGNDHENKGYVYFKKVSDEDEENKNSDFDDSDCQVAQCYFDKISNDGYDRDSDFTLFSNTIQALQSFLALKDIPDEDLKPGNICVYKKKRHYCFCFRYYKKKYDIETVPGKDKINRMIGHVESIKDNLKLKFSDEINYLCKKKDNAYLCQEEYSTTTTKLSNIQDDILKKIKLDGENKYVYVDPSDNNYKPFFKLDEECIRTLYYSDDINLMSSKKIGKLNVLRDHAINQARSPMENLVKESLGIIMSKPIGDIEYSIPL